MTDPQIRLTRDQLAEFLPNSRVIKAFEQLTLLAGTILPDDIAELQRLVEEAGLNAESGVSKANLALALLAKIDPRGRQGVQGIPGMAAEDGEDGLTIVGPQGIQGIQGLQGIPGPSGEDNQEDAVQFIVSNTNLVGPIASIGNVTSVTSQTGTGSTFVMQASPTLTTPNLGTPSALVGTNITGTASGLSIGGNAATATTATNQSGGTVSATTITATSGAITPFYPNGIVGSTSGVSPSAGSIGEHKSGTGSGVALPNSTVTAVASISLSPGNWLVYGSGSFNNTGASTASALFAGINSSVAFPATPFYAGLQYTSTTKQDIPTPTRYFNVSSTTTYYLIMQANYAGGAMTGTAYIQAVRLP